MESTSSSPSSFSKLQAYLELFRLPNVFTSIADVMMGYLFTHAVVDTPGPFLLLIAASAFLYTAGMVLNDVFDLEVDAEERPQRPLPSQRISPAWARMLGFEFLLIGSGLGWLAAYLGGDLRPGVVATVLAVMVWLYDGVLKRTPLAPLAMGGCRFLNVLLGMSLASESWTEVNGIVAGGIGVYIVGVTWFARTEARQSSRAALALATVVMMLGIGLLAWFPSWNANALWNIHVPQGNWHLFWGMIALLIGWRCVRAVFDPSPANVQTAVKQCILSLVMLDAAVCFAIQGYAGIGGVPWAVLILALLVPTMFLGKWIYST